MTETTQTKIEVGDTIEFRAGHFYNTEHKSKINGVDNILTATVTDTYTEKDGTKFFSFEVTGKRHPKFFGVKGNAPFSHTVNGSYGFKVVDSDIDFQRQCEAEQRAEDRAWNAARDARHAKILNDQANTQEYKNRIADSIRRTGGMVGR